MPYSPQQQSDVEIPWKRGTWTSQLHRVLGGQGQRSALLSSTANAPESWRGLLARVLIKTGEIAWLGLQRLLFGKGR